MSSAPIDTKVDQQLLELYVSSNEAFNGTHWREGPPSTPLASTTATTCQAVLQRQLTYLSPVLQKLLGKHVTYLLDIEGTTTPLPFVTKVLFPFAESALDEWVSTTLAAATAAATSGDQQQEHAKLLLQCIADASEDPQNAAELEEVKKANADDSAGVVLVRTVLGEERCKGLGATVLSGSAFCNVCRQRMAENSKVSYLKRVQGYLWKSAYEGGSIQGHVLPDAARAIGLWGAASSSAVHIYSSGSIPAQKLLFGFSTAGDLTPNLSGYYDPSTVGGKAEATSYTNIRSSIDASSAIVFITDSLLEAEAAIASSAIDLVVFSLRPMNAQPLDVDRLARLGVPVVSSFSVITAAAAIGVAEGNNGSPSLKGEEEVRVLWEEAARYREETTSDDNSKAAPLKVFN